MSRSQSLSKKKHIVHPWASLTNRDMMVTVKENLAKEITTLPKKKKNMEIQKWGIWNIGFSLLMGDFQVTC